MDLALQKINELCKFMDFSHAYDFLHDNTIDLNIKRLFVIIANYALIKKASVFSKIFVDVSLFLVSNNNTKLKNNYYIYDIYMTTVDNKHIANLTKDKVLIILKKIVDYKQLDSNTAYQQLIHYRNFIKKLENDKTNEPKTIDDYLIYFSNGRSSKIWLKLDEYSRTGKFPINNLSQEAIDNINKIGIIKDLESVYGLGSVKAKKIATTPEFNIQNIDDLIKMKEDPRLKLTDATKLGLLYHYDIQMRIPREEIDIYNKLLSYFAKLLKFDSSVKYEIVGSYRRGKSESGDIDIIINNKAAYKLLVKAFVQTKISKGLLTNGATKTFLITKLKNINDAPFVYKEGGYPARRMDIMYSPPEEYPFAILYFTGSKEFNTRQRSVALSKGWSLNEHGFTSTISEEEDFIMFWSGKKQFSELSNFYQNPITINNRSYQGGEQAFHGEKFRVIAEFEKDEKVKQKLIDHAKKFLTITDPALAKKTGGKGKYGYALTPEQIEKWNSKAEDVQYEISSAKLEDPTVLQALENTGTKHLYHYSFRAKPGEKWGWKKDKTTGEQIGANKLGEIWMTLRAERFPGLINKSRELPVFTSEEDIFTFLDMDYLSPSERIQ